MDSDDDPWVPSVVKIEIDVAEEPPISWRTTEHHTHVQGQWDLPLSLSLIHLTHIATSCTGKHSERSPLYALLTSVYQVIMLTRYCEGSKTKGKTEEAVGKTASDSESGQDRTFQSHRGL